MQRWRRAPCFLLAGRGFGLSMTKGIVTICMLQEGEAVAKSGACQLKCSTNRLTILLNVFVRKLTLPVTPGAEDKVEEWQVWYHSYENSGQKEEVCQCTMRKWLRLHNIVFDASALYLRISAKGMVKGIPTTQYQKRR